MRRYAGLMILLTHLLVSVGYAQDVAITPSLPGAHADPHIACFDGTYYIYPTTDGIEGWGSSSFSCWSSTDLIHWKNEGVILDFQKDLSWADKRAWAPCIATKNGTYYFYFSAAQQIGVAVSDSPTGPFKDPLARPLVARGAYQCQTIDPMVFVDDDGSAYLYFGQGNCNVVRLNEDMISFDQDQVKRITPKGYNEGAFMLKRQGRYYLMWSSFDTRDPRYCVNYAVGASPMGPFTPAANNPILKQKGIVKAAGHHSVVQVPGQDQWYTAYHRFQIPNGNGYNREVCISPLRFDSDDSIVSVDVSEPVYAYLMTQDPETTEGENQQACSTTGVEEDWFLMTSHVKETDGLLFAVSPDGLKWQAVNNDRSMLKPTVGEVFRDPSVAQDEHGTYHLVWTIAWGCAKHKGFGYASSKDLIHWSDQRIVPVMENEPKTEMVWAPELFWDGEHGQWMIHWSSSVTGKFPETLHLFDGRANPRIYYSVTKDFKTFSPSKLLFNPDCLAIDSYLYQGPDNQYYVFFKADREAEPKRGIMMAKASAPDGPYVVNTAMITPPNEGWAEGPCATRVGETTRLYYAPPNSFGAFESTDMRHWTNICPRITPPGGYRHGTVIRITPAQAQRLLIHEYRHE